MAVDQPGPVRAGDQRTAGALVAEGQGTGAFPVEQHDAQRRLETDLGVDGARLFQAEQVRLVHAAQPIDLAAIQRGDGRWLIGVQAEGEAFQRVALLAFGPQAVDRCDAQVDGRDPVFIAHQVFELVRPGANGREIERMAGELFHPQAVKDVGR